MKNILKHITLAAVPAALLLSGFTAAAQNYPAGSYKVVGGIAFNKSATDNHDGTYTVDLESFVTGKVTTETTTVPADVLLLMDLSSSMSSNGGYDRTYREVAPQAWSKVTKEMTASTRNNWNPGNFDGRTDATESNWSYLYNGTYYPVMSETTSNPTRYHIIVWLPEGKRYLYGTEIHEERGEGVTAVGNALYNGTLYSGGWRYYDFTVDPTNTARNYFYKSGDEYYPVLYKRVQVGSVNTYQAFVPLPSGDKYLMASDSPEVSDAYGHFDSQYNPVYAGDLYRNGGWNSYSITTASATAGHYYKHTDGKYYAVTKGVRVNVNGVNSYQATVVIHNVTYYLHGSTISTEPYPVPEANQYCTIYFNSLYQVASSSGYSRAEGLRRAVTAFITAFSERSIAQGLHHRLAMLEYNRNRFYPKTSGTDDITDTPSLEEAPMSEGRSTHIIKNFLDVTVPANEAILRDAVVMPTNFEASSHMDFGLRLANVLFADTKTKPIDEDGDGTPDEYKRPQIAIIIGDGGATGAYEGAQATALYNAGVTVFFVHVAPGDYGIANVRTVLANSHPEYGSSYYSSYTTANYNAGRRWEFLTKVNDYDETLIDEIISITDDIGGAELEVEGTVVTVDVVSQAFSVPPSGTGAPKVFVAPLTGQTKEPETTLSGEEFVYYTFGTEIPAASFGGDDENITLTEETDSDGNKVLRVTGFDYSKHWCGKDAHASSGFHADGYKLILRFIVEPNDDAVGGPEVKTNTEDSGIYVDGVQIAKFNQPTVELPVQLWIQKNGLNGNDSAVFTIYYADPNAEGNVGKDPKKMTYQSFTKVVVNANTMVDGKKMVKITGLDSKFYYRIKEDAWAWTYDPVTGEFYTSEILTNPIIFENKEKDTVKQAEAVKHNVFTVSTTPVTP